jgi:Fe-Mn family superoxide dismutase
MNSQKQLWTSIVCVLCVIGLVCLVMIKRNSISIFDPRIEPSSELIVDISTAPTQSKPYQVKQFSIVMGPKKLSSKQISDHLQLYAGYVNKRNEIDQALQTVDKSKANQTYSAFRGLKLSETFARNGALLHELYFENIGMGTTMGQKTQEILVKNFGSIENFKEDLMATATAARGWALTCYNLDDNRVQNYLLDAHNEKVPVLTMPLLVVDTYEHAYMIDFGINRKEYLAILWDNINWDVVESRVERWGLCS